MSVPGMVSTASVKRKVRNELSATLHFKELYATQGCVRHSAQAILKSAEEKYGCSGFCKARV